MRLVLGMTDHMSYVGLSEAAVRAMDAFWRRAPDAVLVELADYALADRDIPADKLINWQRFVEALDAVALARAELEKNGSL